MNLTRDLIQRVVLESVEQAVPGFDMARLDADLMGDIGLDSMQVLNLAMEIEDRLDISIAVEVLSEARSLRELVDKLAASAGAAP
jgi:acyl carrier protein